MIIRGGIIQLKIMLANVAISPKNGEFATEILGPSWKKNFDLVKRQDTQIISRFSEWGIVGMEGFFYHAIDHLNAQSVFQQCVTAEKDGFDAIIITCFGDPMLDQIRSFVNIPVISIGEASLRMATIMGKKFGLVTISENNIYEAHHTIESYGLIDYCAGIAVTSEKPKEQPGALINAKNAIVGFKEVTKKLIDNGAEILIPGCGLMSPALRLAPGCEDEYPDGCTEVNGVPIMDVMSVALKMAEMMIELKNAGSTWISRSGFYKMPPQSALESGKMVLEDSRQTFWDFKL